MAYCSAADVVWFIETFIKVPDGRDVGQPMTLMDLEKDWLVAVFDNEHGTRRAILSVARKNGKTSLVAALLLCYIVGPLHQRNAQVFSAALSREQSSLIFSAMAKMIRLNPELMDRISVRDSTRELHCAETGVHFRALSAEASTALGTSPLAFVFDELGAVDAPICDLFDALHSGQAAHANPIEFIISTQASQDGHILSLIIDDAQKGHDPHTVCHLHSAPAECELLDEAAWASANPSLCHIVLVDHLRKDATEAHRMPGREPQFRRFNLNQRVEESSPFVGVSVWRANGSPVKPYAGQPAFAGFDRARNTDLTSLVVIWLDGGIWQVQTHCWLPGQGLHERARRDHADYVTWVKDGFLIAPPGVSIDVDAAATDMLEILAEVNLKALAYDRWGIEEFKAALQRAGASQSFMDKLVAWGQGYQSMSPAVNALETALLNSQIAHGNHPVLSYCAANVTVTQDPAGNRKFDKGRAAFRIDCMVALLMAMGVAQSTGIDPPAPSYELHFV